jgi:hypothetical protein
MRPLSGNADANPPPAGARPYPAAGSAADRDEPEPEAAEPRLRRPANAALLMLDERADPAQSWRRPDRRAAPDRFAETDQRRRELDRDPYRTDPGAKSLLMMGQKMREASDRFDETSAAPRPRRPAR